jgi:hypothetical protein
MQASLTGIRQSFFDIGQRWSNAKQTKTRTFWIAIGAIILALYLGFARGGWVTGGTASRMADTAATAAVVERLAPICVTQFNADPERASKLVELKAVSRFQRANFVKDQGWATMPGEAAPDNRVATECAARLIRIGE